MSSEARPRDCPRRSVMGCPFDLVTFDEALDVAMGWCGAAGRARTLVTMNAALLVTMRDDPDLAHACRSGDLIVPDGVPVVWASAIVGTPLRARVAGVDLMAALLRRAAREGRSVFFLGAKEHVVRALAAWCARELPALRVAGYRNGYFEEGQHAQVIEHVRSSGADLLFVGMPTPFKEVWCERHREALGVRVIMGVGGSFDVIAGFVRRAPAAMQRLGLEWLWRFLMEPRRMWRRYLVTNTLFICRVAREAVRNRILAPPRGALD